MINNFKKCKQCGYTKALDQFRKYSGGRTGTYKTCKTCEKINSRMKYLKTKGDSLSDDERTELDKIYKLYETLRNAGLQPPKERETEKVSIVDTVDEILNAYSAQAEKREQAGVPDNTPAELLSWLECELTEEPDYYLDGVYEDLHQKYRPQLHIDKETLAPVYDETYKQALDAVLDRFYEYETDYYKEYETDYYKG